MVVKLFLFCFVFHIVRESLSNLWSVFLWGRVEWLELTENKPSALRELCTYRCVEVDFFVVDIVGGYEYKCGLRVLGRHS